jgi:predicted permease
LLLRRRVERELADEFQFYLDERTAAEIARGLSPVEARRVALRAMGGIEQRKEECRDARGTQAIEHLLQDVRYGVRSLARNPSFAAAALVSLALGIGANTAIFSIIDALLLDSLPVERPRELVLMNPAGLRNGWTAGDRTWSYPSYLGLRKGQRVFSGLIAARTDAVNLTIDGATRRAIASIVSGNYFDLLGVRPLIGRLLSEADDRIRSAHPVVVISHGFWVELGSQLDIVGRNVRLGGHPFTVIGVAEKGFNGLEIGGTIDLFVPTMMLRQAVTYGDALDERSAHIFYIYARLKPGVSREQAEAQLQPLYLAELEQDVAAMGARRPSGDRWRQGRVLLEDGHRGTSALRRDLETPLVAVMAMTAVLLVITCANIGGLQIARASARMKEISIRLAMGASRSRVVLQLLTESALIAGLGAIAALGIAAATIRGLVSEMDESANRLLPMMTFLDARVLAFTLTVAAATTVLVGLVPALLATSPAVWPALRAGAAADSGGQLRLRRVLVTAQLALSLVLITAAGLFGRTVYNLRHADTGFRTDSLAQFQLNTGAAGYDRRRSEAVFRHVLDAIRLLPGVNAATLAVAPVLDNALISFSLEVEGYSSPDTRPVAAANVVAPGYFQMVGTPLVRGRDFSEIDTSQSRRVAIVSETFVEQYFPNLDPIGRTIGLGYGGPTRFQHEVVGISKDARLNNLRDAPAPTFYLPYTQFDVLSGSFFLVRAPNPTLLRRPIEELVRRHDPELPVVGYVTIDEQIDRLLRPERLVASLSLLFGLLATGLGAIGLYGVMAFSVARRRREIGVRMALGADGGNVLRMILRDAGSIAAVGICLGVVLSFALGRYVESQLYEISGGDLATLGGACGVLVAVALVSGWLPARRASRVNPMVALRYE